MERDNVDRSTATSYGEITLDIIKTLFMVFYYILESCVKFLYTPKKELKDEIVLLTGAAGDIGKLLAVKLAQNGCKLILWDVNESGVKNLADELNKLDNKTIAYPFKCDITEVKGVNQVASRVVKDVGHPTIIINNAGIVAGKYFMDLSLEEIKCVYNVNIISHYQIVKTFLPHMLEHNHGHIVCIASILGMDAVAGVSEYGPSKSSAIQFMKSLRQEIRLLGKDHVYCTTVLPYHIKASLFSGVAVRFNESPLLSSLHPEYVADKIIGGIRKNQIILYLPRILYFAMFIISFLPDRAADMLFDLNEVNLAMKKFVGRNNKKKE